MLLDSGTGGEWAEIKLALNQTLCMVCPYDIISASQQLLGRQSKTHFSRPSNSPGSEYNNFFKLHMIKVYSTSNYNQFSDQDGSAWSISTGNGSTVLHNGVINHEFPGIYYLSCNLFFSVFQWVRKWLWSKYCFLEFESDFAINNVQASYFLFL